MKKEGVCCNEMVVANKKGDIALPWLDEGYGKPTLLLSGDHFRYCPYCGENLSEYYDEEPE